MTSLALNTPVTATTNAMLSMPSISTFGKKMNSNRNLITYFTTPNSSNKKSTNRITKLDWDANRNELEFE